MGLDAPDRLKPETGFYPYKAYIEPPENAEMVRMVIEVAESKGIKPSQIALASPHKGLTSIIIGTSNTEQLEEAVEVLEIKLKGDEIKYLEEPSDLNRSSR